MYNYSSLKQGDTMLTIIIGSVVGIIIGGYHLYLKSVNSHLAKELRDAQERFKITYDLLWMEVRDKNDLTYENMALHIVSMQKSELIAVRDTLALRIVGKSKKVGF